jgi:hypothetical protein
MGLAIEKSLCYLVLVQGSIIESMVIEGPWLSLHGEGVDRVGHRE